MNKTKFIQSANSTKDCMQVIDENAQAAQERFVNNALNSFERRVYEDLVAQYRQMGD